jgi:prepilin peptidase CpaA
MAFFQITISAVVLFTLLAAWTDARTGHVPNAIVLAFALCAAGIRLAITFTVARRSGVDPWPLALDTAASMVLGLVVCAAVPYLMFRLNAMGGGDVKLLAALGLALGPMGGLQVELGAFVIASLFAGARLAYRGHLLGMLKNSALLVLRPFVPAGKRKEVPPELLTSLRFAPALFAAVLVFAWSAWRVT